MIDMMHLNSLEKIKLPIACINSCIVTPCGFCFLNRSERLPSLVLKSSVVRRTTCLPFCIPKSLWETRIRLRSIEIQFKSAEGNPLNRSNL